MNEEVGKKKINLNSRRKEDKKKRIKRSKGGIEEKYT